MTKYIFVTGGVVSGLGKGITSASIGLILKSNGFSVDAVKFDPYLNMDPGTMSPFEHGEVFVLNDGSETDLDLGHYERFLDTDLTKNSSVTSGKIYSEILENERRGDYLGKNVQMIPHVTGLIQEKFKAGSDDYDFRIIEIGGTTGDMEGEVFLQAIRQFRLENRKETLHVHLGYVPYLDCSNEFKSKPFQNSVKDLLEKGMQPDVLVARYAPEDGDIPDQSIFDKMALFSNIPIEAVIPLPDVKSIYLVPDVLRNSNMMKPLSDFVGKKLSTKLPKFYEEMAAGVEFEQTIRVGIVAKYSRLEDAYMSIIESLRITGVFTHIRVNYELIDAELLEQDNEEEWNKLKQCDGIVAAGGFGSRGLEGKIKALTYTRENSIPTLGICLGLQMMVVEFGRNVMNDDSAVTSEVYEDRKELESKTVLIDYMDGQENIHKKGGTMRLGAYECQIEDGTLAAATFETNSFTERHRHRYEVQHQNMTDYADKGLVISGRHHYTDNEGKEQALVEIAELSTANHPYYIGIQSHPELLSRPDKPHPLFVGLVTAAAKANY